MGPRMTTVTTRTIDIDGDEVLLISEAVGFGPDVELHFVRTGDVLIASPRVLSTEELEFQLANVPASKSS